ncbi:hypothetical protein EVAR_27537_1 [Eumeta japonica]|uniref:Uncharacterized protein n=1 Tax=Eumeta variegata TaxID=151549 RepID=A0A4C1W5N0_EUMVA|nr:hypothetical protein EVAR_27537_1 [Eumeta japonica]
MKPNRFWKDLSLVVRNGLPSQERAKKIMVKRKLVPPGKTVNSDLYCQRLMQTRQRLKQEIEKKLSELINRKSVAFPDDKARPHTSLATQQIL